MGIPKVQKQVLFALGQWYNEANKKIASSPLQIMISKSIFIELMMRAGIADKKERALYKNLEDLEKKKLISYANKCLALTEKGSKTFEKIQADLAPYTKVISLVNEKDPLSYSRKVQTVFFERKTY